MMPEKNDQNRKQPKNDYWTQTQETHTKRDREDHLGGKSSHVKIETKM